MMSRLAKREILIVVMLLFGALMLAEHASAQGYLDPDSGTWIVGPRIGPFQQAYGPRGQVRNYIYHPDPYPQYYGDYGYQHDYRSMSRALQEQQFTQELDSMLMREIYGSDY